MKEIAIHITGIRPLIMHNSSMVDPENPFVRRIKEISSKGTRKITDADIAEREHLEWEGGLYWDDELGPVIPADNIERCVQEGAQKSRLGKLAKSSILCTDAIVRIEYKGPRTKEEMYRDRRFIFRKAVGIQKNRIIRVRPMIPTGWEIHPKLEFDESILNESAIKRALADAGALVGLCDWRPKFGRFTVN